MQHSDLYLRLLHVQVAALHYARGLRRHLRSVYLQIAAVHHAGPLRRPMRAVLLQADALSLQSACPAIRLQHAGMLGAGR